MTIDQLVAMSGSVAGCQAECGGDSSMAAGALVELAGGDVKAVGNTAAIALKNTLGLVRDPLLD
jgi:L-serine dehydratase